VRATTRTTAHRVEAPSASSASSHHGAASPAADAWPMAADWRAIAAEGRVMGEGSKSDGSLVRRLGNERHPEESQEGRNENAEHQPGPETRCEIEGQARMQRDPDDDPGDEGPGFQRIPV